MPWATNYGGIGDTSMKSLNPRILIVIVKKIIRNSMSNPPVSLQHLTREMEHLRQTVKDKDIDPRDAITHLEQTLTS